MKVVQTAVAHACDLAVHLVTAQSRRAKTDPAPYSAQNSTLLHAVSTDRRQNRFVSLKKTCCVIYFNWEKHIWLRIKYKFFTKFRTLSKKFTWTSMDCMDSMDFRKAASDHRPFCPCRSIKNFFQGLTTFFEWLFEITRLEKTLKQSYFKRKSPPGRSAVAQRVCFGSRKSRVRSPPPRPFFCPNGQKNMKPSGFASWHALSSIALAEGEVPLHAA